jgi:hypothetical protein
MTNRVAAILFCFIAGAVALDLAAGGGATLAVARSAYAFLDWLIFWR